MYVLHLRSCSTYMSWYGVHAYVCTLDWTQPLSHPPRYLNLTRYYQVPIHQVPLVNSSPMCSLGETVSPCLQSPRKPPTLFHPLPLTYRYSGIPFHSFRYSFTLSSLHFPPICFSLSATSAPLGQFGPRLNQSLTASPPPEAFPAIALVRAPIPVTCISLRATRPSTRRRSRSLFNRPIATYIFFLSVFRARAHSGSLLPSCCSSSAAALF
ncbi:hypothetical protein V8C37DRAFT_214603 [Trichoderma ceciliae]